MAKVIGQMNRQRSKITMMQSLTLIMFLVSEEKTAVLKFLPGLGSQPPNGLTPIITQIHNFHVRHQR